MLSKFCFISSHSNLFNPISKTNVIQRFFSRSEFKSKTIKRKPNPNNKEQTNKSEKPLSNKEALIYFSAFPIFYGFYLYLINLFLTPVNYDTFVDEYLLKGEVKSILFPGLFLSKLGKFFPASAILYIDLERKFDTVKIVDKPPNLVWREIKELQERLEVPKEEHIPFVINHIFDYSFMCAIFVFYIHVNQRKFKFQQIIKEPPKESVRYSRERKHADQFDPFRSMSSIFGGEVEQVVTKTDIKFKDVGGLHEAKMELEEFLQYLTKPKKFMDLGARLPRGALLTGPPGCGKTMLIRALANECNIPFYYYAGTDFNQVVSGVGSQKMRKMFRVASDNAPAIIFLDEIDSIGRKRSGQNSDWSDSEQTLNQLLVELDGIRPNAGIVTFAATNRADVLDRALVRPGRFDRQLLIGLPNIVERKEIIEIYLKKYNHNLDISIRNLKLKLAQQTPGMSGADIGNLCNEAALFAARGNRKTITWSCFEKAIDKIIIGTTKRTTVLGEWERQIVACHEAGHALVGWLLEFADPIIKISIVPRTNSALGFTQLVPNEKYTVDTSVLLDRLTVMVAGRVAETISFNQITSGAQDDLSNAKKLTYKMIREWGMSEKVGHLSFPNIEESASMGSLPYSKSLETLIESEANNLVSTAFKRADKILRDNIGKLELLSKELLAHEVLLNADIEKLIGPRPFTNSE